MLHRLRHSAQWYALTGMGAYHGLFVPGRSGLFTAMNRLFAPFLVCPHCDAPMRITKRSAPRFFVAHKLTCRQCGLEHDFPLFWRMSKTKWRMTEGTEDPSVEELSEVDQ